MANPQPVNPKDALGRLKPPVHAIPPSAIIAMGLAMENGEGKYGLMNWRGQPVIASVYYDAALRHLLSWWDGENMASDSRIHHLAHIMACCAILIDAEMTFNLSDDRPAPGPAAAMIDGLHGQRMDALLAKAAGEAIGAQSTINMDALADAIEPDQVAEPDNPEIHDHEARTS